MKVPVYVVTGFLDSGKTTFLNALLNKTERRGIKTLLLQFEEGEEEFHRHFGNCRIKSFLKEDMEKRPDQIIKAIYSSIKEQDPDEIWIEWNGVTPFSKLQDLLSGPSLYNCCKIRKVLHIAEAAHLEMMLGQTGSALPEQIASSDIIILRASQNKESTTAYQQMRRTINILNPGVPIVRFKGMKFDNLYKWIFRETRPGISSFFLVLICLAALYLLIRPVFNQIPIPVNTIMNVFLGIILQATPFLLLGVILSSLIQIFIPKTWIEKWFPKSLVGGMVIAVLGGFCLPVCDCASIPIFRSLIKKGVPAPAAITFLLAAPVINPVVILSTYHAFGGDLSIVAQRICMGSIAAVIIGLSFAVCVSKGQVLSGGKFDNLMCSCGCYQVMDSVTGLRGKMDLFFRHAQAEFFDVGKYLMLGSFVAAVFQALGAGLSLGTQNGAETVAAMIIMMGMAFVLSLCSSSDAVIARSFSNQFPMAAIMAFLVFGPMMDIKNMMMLSSGFSKRFIVRLVFTSFAVCFTVVFLFYQTGGR
ncbi:MAG: permease [Muricomes sp.]